MYFNILLGILSFLSGAGTVFCMPNVWNYSHLFFMSLIPFLYALDKSKSKKQSLILTILFSLGLNIPMYFWIPAAFHEMWHVNLYIMWIPSLIFFCFCEIHWFVAFILKNKNNLFLNMNIRQMVIFAMIYTGLEVVFHFLSSDELGIVFHALPKFRQVLDISGSSPLSIYYVCVNICLYQLIMKRPQKNNLIFISIFTISLLSYNQFVLNTFKKHKESSPKTVLKYNILNSQTHHLSRMMIAKNEVRVVELLSNLVDKTGPVSQLKNELIIWPEVSYPLMLNLSQSNLAQEKILSLYKDNTFMFGSIYTNKLKNYNAVIIKQGNDFHYLRKEFLFPFGEYIPSMFKDIAFFQNKKSIGEMLTPVYDIDFFDYNKDLRIGSLICYDGTRNERFHRMKQKGINLYINISNESWFLSHGVPEMTLTTSALGSVQTKTPMLRATNYGLSAYINELGDFTQLSEINKESSLKGSIEVISSNYPYRTLFSLFGNWVAYICFVVIILRISIILKNKSA